MLDTVDQFLTPRDLGQLSGANAFFYHHVSFQINYLWKKNLSRDFQISLEDSQSFSDNEVTLKNVYRACSHLKKIGFPQITFSHLAGYLGKVELVTSVLKSKDEETLLHLLVGAAHGFQLDGIKLILSAQDVPLKVFQTLLEHATAANNLLLLHYLNEELPQLIWSFVNANGNNLLYTAAYHGSYEAFRFLLETKRLDPFQLNNAKSNLLASLSYSHNPQLVEYICIHLSKLDPFHANNAKLTPYQIAKTNNNQIVLRAYDAWSHTPCAENTETTNFSFGGN